MITSEMKKNITTREDIKELVDRFYEKVRIDQSIGFLFNDIARVNWEKHLPRMYDFWENIAFQTGSYIGNPMIVHADLHKKYPLSKKHFEQWLQLFISTVDEYFEGERAELVKKRAFSIAAVIQHNQMNKDLGLSV